MTIEAFAKVNLTLEVFDERSDGYHALRSVVLPVTLSDTLAIELTADGTISCDTGYADDLCLKAARALRAVRDARLPASDSRPGATIRVTKRIPVGGGLGGGSADAAATLLALNELWHLGKTREELAEIGAMVGSDVPSLVLGGPVLMEGRGEKVSRLLSCIRPLDLVLVNPGVACSTPEVYAHCVPRLPKDGSIVYNIRHALGRGDLKGIAVAMMNDLQDPAVALHPEIGAALEALRAAGVEATLMSGSGSTVFGLVPSEAEGRKVSALLRAQGLWAQAVKTCDCPVV